MKGGNQGVRSLEHLRLTLPPLYTSLASMVGIETVGPLASLPAAEWRAPESSP